jgi:hypothetical protein
MGKFDSLFKVFWRGHRKLDPISAKALETTVKYDTKLIREGLSLAEKNTGGKLNEWIGGLKDESNRVIDDPVRGIGRGAATAAALMGGAALLGGGGTAGGGTAATGSGNGAWLGEGTTSGVPAWDKAMSAAKPAGRSMAMDSLMRLGQQMSQQPIDQMEVARADEDPQTVLPTQFDSSQLLLGSSFAPSSKRIKKPAGEAAEAVRRGLAGENPIDENGVLIARIQDLSKRIARLQRRADALTTGGEA